MQCPGTLKAPELPGNANDSAEPAKIAQPKQQETNPRQEMPDQNKEETKAGAVEPHSPDSVAWESSKGSGKDAESGFLGPSINQSEPFASMDNDIRTMEVDAS